MRMLDRYDYVGLSLVALLVVVWALHFILPAPPPEEPEPGAPPAIGRPFP